MAFFLIWASPRFTPPLLTCYYNVIAIGVSLTTKFDTTVQIDPPDPQRRELQAWVTEKRQILTSFTLRSTSTSAFLISVPMDEEIVPIASIDSQQDVDLTLRGQDVHYPTIRQINCMNCDPQNLLVPSCKFDVDLPDDSGSTIRIIMDKEGEKLLSLTLKKFKRRGSFIQ
ncbi:hypothetical protein H5410_065062 [Solanum commersonii]|uniref:Uncharacterized protein n=1 Tax=Solanum commersonii TaxID=4109 RepID=A0A9J5VXL3_SOLCO|nr:hypothetical protein H5410_065062 [Solanum commersonii]